MIKSLTFNQLLTYEGERFAQSFNVTIDGMLFFRWCQILVPKFWIGFQYWANVWNDSTICLWKTQQEVLDSPVLECRNWRSERPLFQCQYFQFHQFQFQFQFWNRNWAAFPILELNWPQSCMQWLGNELVTSQYLNLWWPELCLHMVSPALNRLRYLLSLHW